MKGNKSDFALRLPGLQIFEETSYCPLSRSPVIQETIVQHNLVMILSLGAMNIEIYLGLDEWGSSPLQAWRRVKRKIKAVPGLISPRRELRPPLGECGLALVLRSRVELVSTAKQGQQEKKQELHLRARCEVHCPQNWKQGDSRCILQYMFCLICILSPGQSCSQSR